MWFWWVEKIGSLSNNVFERRTSTGSGLFSFFDGAFAQIFSQIASIIVKKLKNTNFISSRHVKRENTSLPVNVRRSKTSLLKLPIVEWKFSTLSLDFCSHEFYGSHCGKMPVNINPFLRIFDQESFSLT